MYLCLSRKPGETIELMGGKIVIKLYAIEDGRAKLAISAPPDIDIWRGELADEIRAEYEEGMEAE